ncbi:glycosyltransferase [Xylophilus sp.]|uniref:glycosyltransferase n=1 Tax=Xylophilus sp. TaxID=2653893 RepID=UPI0013B8D6BC|nr:glycosyltransferase [Xylophilus sp.]KAF1049282.1 MAG: putative teichuronic acid biosynthesis glycosyltransferase TuaH [Xylophilus sp.]
MHALLVFSHLRWDFVYQRPQHLLSRLAARWPVVYVEEPVPGAAVDRLECIDVAGGVQVWRPHLRTAEHGMHGANAAAMRSLVLAAMHARNVTPQVLWFYTPMALFMAPALRPDCVVYDCMDELSMFRGAPAELVEQEKALFGHADIVFTGGRSLYQSKRTLHRNVHCFPSSVDRTHFSTPVADHPLQAALGRPRIGYCGVIDERIDTGLVAGIASQRPDWQLVMVGPTAKIDPAGLPRMANIHWLGQQDYQALPSFIQGWDVCLLPFALNDSTRFLSPTKTLEYMASGRPSVSTAVRDVVDSYGQVVQIRSDADGFVQACEMLMHRDAARRRADGRAVDAILARTSWDATAGAMRSLVEGLLQSRLRTARRRPAPAVAAAAGTATGMAAS